MKRKFLEDLGLEKDAIDSIMTENGKDIEAAKGDTKTLENKVSTLEAEITGLKGQVSDRDKQLETLKASTGDAEALKQQIEDLQTANKEQQKKHDAEMSQLRLDNAIDSALTAAGAKNLKAVRAMLDVSAFKLGEDGTVTGLKEALAAVQKSDAYMFNESQPQANFKGFQPGASGEVKPGTKVDVSKMTYTELAAYMAANPDAVIE